MPLQVGEEVEQGRGEEDTGAIFLRTAKEDNGSGQINKWGFAPGEDDTQDLNMEYKGAPFRLGLSWCSSTFLAGMQACIHCWSR